MDFTANKIIISLFDYTGEWSKPYKNNGWQVEQIDIKLGRNILDFEPDDFMDRYLNSPYKYSLPTIGILAAVPCTDYALSGAKWFKAKDEDGRTAQSQLLVAKTKKIIDFFTACGSLDFWVIENPMSRIHSLNTWMGKPKHKFNPCDYAGYSENIEKNMYNKQTWLWGSFHIPEKKYFKPLQKESPIFTNHGGKSERTKELRSITPDGFANAFYYANH